MPFRRAALLTALLCLLVAAPAAASERSEARRYAAAMEPKIVLTPDEAEALVADYEARSAHVAATCLDAVKAGARKPGRRIVLSMLYFTHTAAASYERQTAWMRAADDRLAGISTDSRILRKGRASRRAFTAFLRKLSAAAPADFCGMVTAWQARAFKGTPAEWDAIVELVAEIDDAHDKRLARAGKLLKRSGATRAQRAAFGGEADWPEFREPARDLVAEALGEKRADTAGSRTPW